VAACRGPAVRLDAGGRPIDIPLTGPTDREPAIRTLTRLFKSHAIPVRESLRDQLREAAGAPRLQEVMLAGEDVEEMQRLGMTIGAHTLTHPNLPNAGLEAAAHEITGAKTAIERQLGRAVTMFSYPNGGAERYMTRDIEELVRSAGYSAATTSRNAFATHASNLFALERIQVRERLEDLVFALEIERFGFKPAARAGEIGVA
jgi:hypothetical protein